MSIESDNGEMTPPERPRPRGNGTNAGFRNPSQAANIVANPNIAVFIAVGFDGTITLYRRVQNESNPVPDNAEVISSDSIAIWVTRHAENGFSDPEGEIASATASATKQCVTTYVGGQPVTVCK